MSGTTISIRRPTWSKPACAGCATRSTRVLAARNSSILFAAWAMLFDRLRSLRRTLAFRLTVWYAAIFTVSSLLAFFFFYVQIASILNERTDNDLAEDIEEFSFLLASKGIEE